MIEDFERRLSQSAEDVTHYLDGVLASDPAEGEIARPGRLLEAMRHAALNGGKRIRPFLVLESAAMFGVSQEAAMPTAAALECVHCYSLVHDDLPAMDDDDMRRGQPTVHIKWDEATAILAGDGLLTIAFDLIARPNPPIDGETRSELTMQLARAAGIGGMAGGQMLDLMAETGPTDQTGIGLLQSMKTGALLRFACEAGAILGNASPEDRMTMRKFGERIGEAFQLADDILDVTASSEAMGKKTGKDGAAGKATLVGLQGLDRARKRLGEITAEARQLISGYGAKSEMLSACARHIAEREN